MSAKRLGVVLQRDSSTGTVYSEIVDIDSVREFTHHGVVVDRMRGPRMTQDVIRSRAISTAKLIGCEFIDLTSSAEPVSVDAAASLAVVVGLRREIDELRAELASVRESTAKQAEKRGDTRGLTPAGSTMGGGQTAPRFTIDYGAKKDGERDE